MREFYNMQYDTLKPIYKVFKNSEAYLRIFFPNDYYDRLIDLLQYKDDYTEEDRDMIIILFDRVKDMEVYIKHVLSSAEYSNLIAFFEMEIEDAINQTSFPDYDSLSFLSIDIDTLNQILNNVSHEGALLYSKYEELLKLCDLEAFRMFPALADEQINMMAYSKIEHLENIVACLEMLYDHFEGNVDALRNYLFFPNKSVDTAPLVLLRTAEGAALLCDKIVDNDFQ
jgi:hypothetical protein